MCAQGQMELPARVPLDAGTGYTSLCDSRVYPTSKDAGLCVLESLCTGKGPLEAEGNN